MITVGITTYNRSNMLRRMACSFYSSERPYQYAVRIYDDASSDFDINWLRKIFPDAVSIYRHSKNVGADANTWYMYNDFLKSGDDILFNADSDLIFSRDWMEEGIRLLELTDGICSIFTTPTHPPISEGETLHEKKDIGAAGTFFRRDLLERFVKEGNASKSIGSEGIDYQWCRYFRSIGCRIYSSSRSFVQHIGFDGYNSSMDNFDYGEGFHVDSISNGQFINDSIEEGIRINTGKKRSYALFPFENIPKGSEVILYGFGSTGKDFASQILNSGYCKLSAIVDKNYAAMQDVESPQRLLHEDYDYIVLSTLNFHLAADMKKDIEALSPSLLSKIVQKDSASVPIRL